ncbi:MAG: hypothetical protein WC549_07685, partial [Actinomycetota bacterium]
MLSISMIAAFSLYGCKEEEVAEEATEEEATEEEVAEEEVAEEEEEVVEELPADTTAHLVIWCWSPNDVDLDYALTTTGFN